MPHETVDATRDPEDARPGRPLRDEAPVLALDERRFQVGDERARGGIGRILAARDGLLQRPIALKQLLDASGSEQMARFMREAIVTARLQHPSIVPVYDAGTRASGEPYYAMPLLPGKNLHQVFAAAPGLRERLALLPHVQAVADAIAYAHDQRVVHRDLKPANVLVGPFGETVVIDWGLAKDLDGEESAGGAPLLPDVGPLVLDVTRSGVAVGTPAYMAPEQARGEPVDERCDVYALGAMLYHLLTGRAPHDADHPASAGPPPALDRVEPRAPRDLVSIVGKAMAAAPVDRYRNAGLLAQDLRRFATGQLVGARRYRPWTLLRRFVARHRVTVLAALLVAGMTVAIAVPIAHRAGAAPSCGGDEELIAGVWNPDRAAAIRAHLTEVAGAAGAAQWDRAAGVFDAYARRWVVLRRESCQATRVRHEQSDSMFDRRQFCFDRRKAQLGSIAGMLTEVDSVRVALDVTELAAELPALDDCATARLVNDASVPPLAQRAAVKQVYAAFDAARNLSLRGRYLDAMIAYLTLEPPVEVLGYPVLDAELHAALGFVAMRQGDFEVSTRAHERALAAASTLGRVDWIVDAELELIAIEAMRERFANVWARVPMLTQLARVSPDPLQRVRLHGYLAFVLDVEGRVAEALAEARKQVELMPKDGSFPPEADARRTLGRGLALAGRYDEAEVELRAALEAHARRHGPDNPSAGYIWMFMGDVAFGRERFAEALGHYEKTLALFRKETGDADNADTMGALQAVGITKAMVGDLEAGLATMARALELRRKYDGDTHVHAVALVVHMAMAQLRLERPAEAEATLREFLPRLIASKPPGHASVTQVQGALAEVLLARGDAGTNAAARALCDEALAVVERARVEPGIRVAEVLVLRAQAHLALGQPAGARADAERVLTLLGGLETEGVQLLGLEARVVLAELRLAERRPVEALALVQALPDGGGLPLSYGRLAFVRARALAGTGRREEALALARRELPGLREARDPRATRLADAMQAFVDAR